MITLYDDQVAAVDQIRAAIRALRAEGESPRVLLVAPCGAGKGTIASWMIKAAADKGTRILFLVNRRGLVKDLSRRLYRLGVPHGVIMAGFPSKPWEPVQVASIDTLHRRPNLPPAGLIFLDEAHFSLSPIWLSVAERYPEAPFVGMTATPVDGMGKLYKRMVLCPQTAELTEMGRLTPLRVYAPTTPDLKGVTSGKDYNESQLAAVMDKAKLIGDLVKHWMSLSKGRPTICNAVNVGHSKHIVELFRAAGVRAFHADANTPDDERDRLWKGLETGDVEFVSQVGIASYGWDCPVVSTCILARPTKSLALYLQMVGRVARTYPGKDHALVLDHAGCALQHGLPDEEREWTLDGVKKKSKKVDRALSIRMCKTCYAAFRSNLPACPYCGWVYPKHSGEVKTVDGELQEITGKVREPKISKNPAFAYFQQIRLQRGYKPGYVFRQMEKFMEGNAALPPDVFEAWKAHVKRTGQAHLIDMQAGEAVAS